MPLNKKGKKILAAMKSMYGKKGEHIFHASKNKGAISGVEKRKRLGRAADGFFGNS